MANSDLDSTGQRADCKTVFFGKKPVTWKRHCLLDICGAAPTSCSVWFSADLNSGLGSQESRPPLLQGPSAVLPSIVSGAVQPPPRSNGRRQGRISYKDLKIPKGHLS